jgi:peptidyl-tRNA hydrolase
MQRIKILARKKLNMSPGKLAAQSVHAALALAGRTDLHPMMSVVVLMVNETPFNKAKEENEIVAVVRDAGYTEVEPGTETVLAFLEGDPRGY